MPLEVDENTEQCLTPLPPEVERELATANNKLQEFNSILTKTKGEIMRLCSLALAGAPTTAALIAHSLENPNCGCEIPAVVSSLISITFVQVAYAVSKEFKEAKKKKIQLLVRVRYALSKMMIGNLHLQRQFEDRGIPYETV